MNPATLPDLDQLPSVLETSEVNAVLAQAVEAIERNPNLPQQEVVDCVVDAMFARGYRPDEEFDVAVSGKILDWIKHHWGSSTPAFIDAARTALTNLNHPDIDPFLAEQLAVESREFARVAIRECQAERTKPANRVPATD
jgi:hypothetical protein